MRKKRARARWHEHGERSSKYLLNLEKRHNVKGATSPFLSHFFDRLNYA